MSEIKQMEKIESEFMTPIVSLGAGLTGYREETAPAYAWKCLGCGLVWGKRWWAETCEHRNHASSFEQHYYSGGGNVNGVYTGKKSTYVRRAIRREPA